MYQVDKVVDTTGAGDAFVGSLAYLIASNKDIPLEQVNYFVNKSMKKNFRQKIQKLFFVIESIKHTTNKLFTQI